MRLAYTGKRYTGKQRQSAVLVKVSGEDEDDFTATHCIRLGICDLCVMVVCNIFKMRG